MLSRMAWAGHSTFTFVNARGKNPRAGGLLADGEMHCSFRAEQRGARMGCAPCTFSNHTGPQTTLPTPTVSPPDSVIDLLNLSDSDWWNVVLGAFFFLSIFIMKNFTHKHHPTRPQGPSSSLNTWHHFTTLLHPSPPRSCLHVISTCHLTSEGKRLSTR